MTKLLYAVQDPSCNNASVIYFRLAVSIDQFNFSAVWAPFIWLKTAVEVSTFGAFMVGSLAGMICSVMSTCNRWPESECLLDHNLITIKPQ